MNEDQFLTSIENFLLKTGTHPSTFGATVLNDPNFVFDLREGRSCSLRIAHRVMQFIATQQTKPKTKRK